ncbi:MAG: UDP-galactopyranose mutase [Tannerellaceae bacterium]|jgi:UDP-galactopyranose mutase|nr:UDP-galactopyranose mutase [Tannerellaceae bacterium]
MKQYDYLIVGAGLYGATFAHLAAKKGKQCLVIDKRPHTGGNTYCDRIEDINVHVYGAHIFHTSNKDVWTFVNSIVEFNRYTNSPVANYKGKLYNLPFNMNTFYALWGVKTPDEAKEKIEEQRREAGINNPRNLEEQAISLVGKDIYEILIKGYTEKQWGRKCTELPAFIIRRLPVRFSFDNNYFNDLYQGIPTGGYNRLIDGLLKGIEVRCNTDFFADRQYFADTARQIVFTGNIDEYFDYKLGHLQYRTLHFETEIRNCENHQGVAVMNYTEADIPYTRIIEHKHFEFGTQPRTVITREYPSEWSAGAEAFYPINDERNERLSKEYQKLASGEANTIFGGRLGEYKYYDMDKIIENVLAKEI